MNNYRFDSNRKRVLQCPCGKSNHDGKFVPFVGHDKFGHCFSCGKTSNPGEVEQLKTSQKTSENFNGPVVLTEPSFIPLNTFKESLRNYTRNNFIDFLIHLVGTKNTKKLIKKYFIGTSKFWPNSTVFWQLAKNEPFPKRIRAGKIIQYCVIPSDKSIIGLDCKRNKSHVLPVKWVHKAEGLDNYNLKQCLFGEHLLDSNPRSPVAIVESEKSAIIASIYLPQFVWLATGGISNLNLRVFEILKGRSVTLYPDLNGFDLWNDRVKYFSGIAKITISDLLERKASEDERKAKLDLADFLIRFNYKNFSNANNY